MEVTHMNFFVEHINNIKIIDNIKEKIQPKTYDDSLEKIIVFDETQQKMNNILLQHEHNRMINIHNLDAYFDLVDRNNKRFHELNIWLHHKHYKDYQKEVVKEIALQELFKKRTLKEIDELIQDHETNKNQIGRC